MSIVDLITSNLFLKRAIQKLGDRISKFFIIHFDTIIYYKEGLNNVEQYRHHFYKTRDVMEKGKIDLARILSSRRMEKICARWQKQLLKKEKRLQELTNIFDNIHKKRSEEFISILKKMEQQLTQLQHIVDKSNYSFHIIIKKDLKDVQHYLYEKKWDNHNTFIEEYFPDTEKLYTYKESSFTVYIEDYIKLNKVKLF